MNELLMSMIELKICDCTYELGRLEHDYLGINKTEEDKIALELRKEYLKGKITALEQVLELMKVDIQDKENTKTTKKCEFYNFCYNTHNQSDIMYKNSPCSKCVYDNEDVEPTICDSCQGCDECKFIPANNTNK